MAFGRPPRLPEFSYRGGWRYFVTCCTFARRRLFIDQATVDPIALQILLVARRLRFAVLAYVFMPDHLHFLVQGESDDADFRSFMRRVRQRSTVLQADKSTPLWQDGYYERVLRREEDTPSVIRYILENPVRAGLVEDILAYPFLWSVETHDIPPQHVWYIEPGSSGPYPGPLYVR